MLVTTDASAISRCTCKGSGLPCAGDDRHEHRHPASEAEARALMDLIQNATRAILLGPKPVVGAINGYAVGGGFEGAINCDFPIWEESAVGFFPMALSPLRIARPEAAAIYLSDGLLRCALRPLCPWLSPLRNDE